MVDAGNFAVHTKRIQSKDLAIQRRKVELILDGFANSSIVPQAIGIGERDLLMGGEWLLENLSRRQLPHVLSNISCSDLSFQPVVETTYQGVPVQFYAFISPSVLESKTIGEQHVVSDMIGDCIVQAPNEWMQKQAAPSTNTLRIAFADLSTNEIDSIAPYVDMVIESKIGKTTSSPQALDTDSVLVGVGAKGKNLGILTWEWDNAKQGFSSVGAIEGKQKDLERRKHRLQYLEDQESSLSPQEIEAQKLQRQIEYTQRAIIKLEAEISSVPEGNGNTMDLQLELKPLNRQIENDQTIETLIAQAQADITNLESQDAVTPYTGDYVGSQACANCHQDIYASWSKTAHAKAWETLVVQDRALDPACFSCHSTGGGLENGPSRPLEVSQAKHLQGVGCESCHGAGKEHLANVNANTVHKEVPNTVCVTCHNGIQDNGEFDSLTYRPRILHDVQ